MCVCVCTRTTNQCHMNHSQFVRCRCKSLTSFSASFVRTARTVVVEYSTELSIRKQEREYINRIIIIWRVLRDDTHLAIIKWLTNGFTIESPILCWLYWIWRIRHRDLQCLIYYWQCDMRQLQLYYWPYRDFDCIRHYTTVSFHFAPSCQTGSIHRSSIFCRDAAL